MNLQLSNNFTFARQMAVTSLVRQADISIQTALQLLRNQVQVEPDRVLIGEITLAPAPPDFLEYLEIRDALLGDSPYLFPSVKGGALQPGKFTKAQQQCLAKAGAEPTPTHPNKLSESQLASLAALRFNIRRPQYQRTLAVALSVHLAMRPSEVAKLIKSDFDFRGNIIRLRETKSKKKKQFLPIPQDLREPLRRYLAHLPSDEDHLFINSAGNPWDRRDVLAAVKQRGIEKGITSTVTARRIRPTVVGVLIQKGMHTAIISQLLRHSDERTIHTNYINPMLKELSKQMETLYHPLDMAQFQEQG